MAERHAAIHAARALRAEFFFGKVEIDLEPIVYSLAHRTPRRRLTRVLHEASIFTHAPPAPPPARTPLVQMYAPVFGGFRAHACTHGGTLSQTSAASHSSFPESISRA